MNRIVFTKQRLVPQKTEGLKLEISDVSEKKKQHSEEKNKIVKGIPLTSPEVQALFQRIPEIKEEKPEEFAKHSETLPPPKTGNIVPVSFSKDQENKSPARADSEKLRVLRYSPEGKVSVTSNISITFSEPMVSLTSQENASEVVPIEVTPALPEGKWRWLGTKTLIFDAKTRLPMSTKFNVRVPAGIKSATGKALEEEFIWTFTTSPPSIVNHFPSEGMITNRNPVIFIEFDQKINPEEMLKSILVSTNTKQIHVRLASKEEAEDDENTKNHLKNATPDRYIIFRLVTDDGKVENALPPNSKVEVKVLKGAPSAEGPVTTNEEQTFSFKTFGPMRFLNKACANQYETRGFTEKCSPFSSWSISFSNEIDVKSFDPSMIKIEPQIENLKVYPTGKTLIIEGLKRGQTVYKVSISKQIRDIFGQNLENPISVFFLTTSARPFLSHQSKDLIVADPFKKPTFSIYSMNLPAVDAYFYKVSPESWLEFYRIVQSEKVPLPYPLIKKERIEISKVPDQIVETKIDLFTILTQGKGQILIHIKPIVPVEGASQILVWYQATQIGIETVQDGEDLIVRVSDLKNGKPLADAEVTIYPDNLKAFKPSRDGVFSWLSKWLLGESEGLENTTDENGILRFPLPKKEIHSRVIIAKKDHDQAFLPYYSEWQRAPKKRLEWFVFDDRKIYRPGEEVNVKGYLRVSYSEKLKNIFVDREKVKAVEYSIRDPLDNEFAKGVVSINSFGAFDFKFKIPNNVHLGAGKILLKAIASREVENQEERFEFQIQEFRRPEFEVKSKVLSAPPYILKKEILTSIEARYYAGGLLSGSPVTWNVTAIPTNYTPPNRSDYSFGIQKPWWINKGEESVKTLTLQGKTDDFGKHILKIKTEEASPPRPFRLEISGAVEDVNRQRWSSSTSLLLHPSSLYIGVRAEKYFIQINEPLNIEAIVTDIDGNLVAQHNVQIKAEFFEWQLIKGKWKEVKVDEQLCSFISSNPFRCSFTAKKGDRLQIKATVFDEMERPNETEITVWISSAKLPEEPEIVKKEEIKLIPDKEKYQIGETAEILVLSPFPDAEGFLTLRQEGIFKVEKLSLKKGSSTVLKIPIQASYLPNFHVHVTLSGVSKRDKAEKPAFAEGEISIPVSLKSKTLNVSIHPERKNLSPSEYTKINLEVKDKEDKPVPNIELAVVIADESILSLVNYKIPNPLNVFYEEIRSFLSSHNLRSYVSSGESKGEILEFNEKNLVLKEMSSLETKGHSFDENATRLYTLLRTDFSPLVLFSPSVITDSNGKATLNFKLPDNLTRYRITAVAVNENGELYGIGEENIIVRKPLMLRPSPPRFMNFGDRIELPIVLQNQTDKELNVKIGIRASNAKINGIEGKNITVPANDRVEVRFPVSTVKPGKARFQVVAVSSDFSDAVEFTLPVWTPATSENFATYGNIDDNKTIIQPLEIPINVHKEFGHLEITTSSTQLQELTDAFIYLCRYPFESSESIASRMISIATLYDILKAFNADNMPSEDEIKARIEEDIRILESRQMGDGSFGLWKAHGERFKYPFVTIHVTHALILAKSKGYKIPDAMLEKALWRTRNIEDSFEEWHKRYRQLSWMVSAYALYVRSLIDDVDQIKAQSILKETDLENLPFESVGWLLSTLSRSKRNYKELEEIKRYLTNKVAETSKTANFVTSYEDGQWLVMHSNRRADAILLEAMIEVDPRSDLIPKLVRGLLENRRKGRWSSTQENVFILIALKKYFDTYEVISPDFVARLWIGETFAGEQRFRGRSTESKLLRVPISHFSKGKTQLILQKEGAGRLYYRLGLKYASENLKLNSADYGFTVLRRYEAVESPDDVRQIEDGKWIIKPGALVRVHLTMVADSRRYHVILVDYLPAGLEPLNPALAVTEKISGKEERTLLKYGSRSSFFGSWWQRHWFEHQNLRDERVEVFSSLVWEGIYEYSYFARATTPGEFVVPPARAEEMYSPETFGHSNTDFVTVSEK